MERLSPYKRVMDAKLGHVRCVTISVDKTKPKVYKLKGGVITSIIRDTGQGLSLQ